MILLDTTIDVHYGFVFLHSAEIGPAENHGFDVLCDATVPGELALWRHEPEDDVLLRVRRAFPNL